MVVQQHFKSETLKENENEEEVGDIIPEQEDEEKPTADDGNQPK